MDWPHLARRALPGEPASSSQRFWSRVAVGAALGALGSAALLVFSGAVQARDVPPPPTLAPERGDMQAVAGPTRVGRVVALSGRVAWWDDDQGEWVDAEKNRALASGDRIATAQGAHAELRIGSTTVRIGGDRGPAELELARMDGDRLVLHLHSGSLGLRVRSREIAAETEVLTDEVRLVPVVSGHYRIDRIDDVTQAGAWRGILRVVQQRPVDIPAGQWAELWREPERDRRTATDRGDVRVSWGTMPDDAFSARVQAADNDESRTASHRYVSPEMTGAEDLDRHGRWDRHPDYGAIWFPTAVAVDWAPFRHGRWVWSVHWGWTWVDRAPWGFAPSHYGRWVWWRDRWGWCPGGYVSRPVFAPAVVGWVGGPNWSVSVNIGGGPAVGWVPLSPRDRYVPWTPPRVVVVKPDVPPPWRRPLPNPRYGPQGEDRWEARRGEGNGGHGMRPPVQRVVQALPPPPVPVGPVSYGNQGVPNAVTVVPRDALVRREVPTPQAAQWVGPAAPAGLSVGTGAPAAVPPAVMPPGLSVGTGGAEREVGRDRDRERDREREGDGRARQRWEESGRGAPPARTTAPALVSPTPAAPPAAPPMMQMPRATPLPQASPPPVQAVPVHGPMRPAAPERREPRAAEPPREAPAQGREREERVRVPAEVRHGGREREAAR
jgi:hypothetical protein